MARPVQTSVAAGPFQPAWKGITDAAVFREIDRASDGTIWTMATHGGVYSMAHGQSQFTLVHDELANYGSTPLMNDTLFVARDYRLDFFDVITRQSIGNLTYLNVLFPQDFVKAWGGMYLSTSQDGIFRYANSQTWQPFNQELASTVVHEFRYYKGHLWAANSNGLFKRGATDDAWTRIAIGDANEFGTARHVQGVVGRGQD